MHALCQGNNLSGGEGAGINGTFWGVSGNSLFYNIGNVSIGTRSPQAKLDVNGDFKISGKKPIIIKRGYYVQDRTNTEFSTENYEAAIVGFRTKSGDIYEDGKLNKVPIIQCYMKESSGLWHIYADFRSEGTDEHWEVDVMFIDKKMVDTQ